jgi:hypothetical protein
MNPSADPGGPQVSPQRIAFGDPDHILVEDMGGTRTPHRKD